MCVCRTVLNGNGKLPWELEEAARQGVLINVDSEFDLANIIAAAKSTATPVKVLLRINPDVDPKVLLHQLLIGTMLQQSTTPHCCTFQSNTLVTASITAAVSF